VAKKQARRPKHTPQRTCIVCRDKVDKRRLTRIVRTPDEGVVIDPTGKRHGRGAYLCDRPECWDKAVARPQLLNKALMTEVTESEMREIASHKPVAEKVTE
jgi:predicted RNA-binding protein YlxR (DUF448 family)